VAALTANTAALAALAAAVFSLEVMEGGLMVGIATLQAAIDANTIALYATGFFGFQSGGIVPGPPSQGVRAVVHGGELVANESMMRSLGAGVAVGSAQAAIHSAQGLNAGGGGDASALQGVADSLQSRSAAGPPQTVSFQGAVFHGVPDQRYVQGIMDQAVTQLRNSSRSWAFNPKGQ